MKQPTITEIAPIIGTLLNEPVPKNMVYGACEHCGSELRHGKYELPGGKFIYPKLECDCVIKKRDREIAIANRKMQSQEIQRHMKSHLINPKIVDATFASFQEREGAVKMAKKCLEYANNFEEQKDGLILFGGVGGGKSHLARAIQRKVEAEGWATLFLDFPQLIELAKETFSSQSANINNILRGAIEVDLLVLDELGFLHLTAWEAKTLLFPIINGREGKKTIITTNLNPDELENWFMWGGKDGREVLDDKGRIYDRLYGSCRFIINRATSYRKESRNKKVEG